jgi:hypothetical protein
MFENFFIEKIQSVLEGNDRLNKTEVKVLNSTPFEALEIKGFDNVKAQKLHSKCLRALDDAYDDSVESYGTDYALSWRDAITGIYNDSDKVISAIVQDWYLKSGRRKEKAATKPGCLPVFLLILVGISLPVVSLIIYT